MLFLPLSGWLFLSRYRAELSPSGYDPPCLFSFP
jgi:hypothetical protein